MNREEALKKVIQSYKGINFGDAYGAGYEFYKGGYKAIQKDIDFTKYSANKSPQFRHKAGKTTDDSQMSQGVVETLLKTSTPNNPDFANSFVDCYKRESSVGYAKRFQEFLDNIKSGEEFVENIKPSSERNGAAMRSVPFGHLPNLEDCIMAATTNAKVTHNTPKGIASGVGTAVLSHYVFNNGISEDMFPFVMYHIKGIDSDTLFHLRDVMHMHDFDEELMYGHKKDGELRDGIPCDGMRTLGAVMHILSKYNTASDVLRESVLLGGDTDSVASIALGIYASANSIDDLPEFLEQDIYPLNYGLDYMKTLAEKFVDKYY